MLEIRDANARLRTDLTDNALIDAIKRVDPDLVAGSLNELVLRRDGLELVCHLSEDGRYMLTHVDADNVGRTAIADGDPAEKVTIVIGGQPEEWPGDHFLPPYLAAGLAARFVLDGEREETVDWRKSTAHL